MLVGGGVINSDKTINATSATIDIPTGEISFDYTKLRKEFIVKVPRGIHVLLVDKLYPVYIAVKPETTHRYYVSYIRNTRPEIGVALFCKDHLRLSIPIGNKNPHILKIKWSPTINKHTPDPSYYPGC